MSTQEAGLASLGGIPVRYVGKKARKLDNVAGTGVEWTPGQVHILPPLVAQKLVRFADIWREADPSEVEADPASLGMVVETQTAESQIKPPEINQPTFDLPNLQGMTKTDLQTFAASQFNQQLDGRQSKEALVQQIVALANSRAAGEP